MRYHYAKPKLYLSMYGEKYYCNHPVYDQCTLYLIGNKGLAVIQQRYNPTDKTTFWTSIDDWLTDELYLNERFLSVFNKKASEPKNDIYPTVTIRQLMWALRMKPLPKEKWETCFDRRFV